MSLRPLCVALVCLGIGFSPTVRGSAAAGSSVSAQAENYSHRVERELRGDILPFWLAHARDREGGGFYGEIDGDLHVKKDAPRGALLTCRILWTFSAAYERYRDPAYLDMARWAYDDLLKRFWDERYGGFYWKVSADGVPIDARKIMYVQAFGLYGLSEFYRATGDKAVLGKAIELFHLVQSRAHDRINRGYFEELTRDWQVSRDRGKDGSAMGSRDQKSQNVHLHILEAWTNLYRVWPDADLKSTLREIVDVLLTKVLDPRTHHLRLFLAEDWSPRSDTISFGHDIEFSWLLTETAGVLADEALGRRVKVEAVKIAAVTLQEGVDPDGGVLGEADPKGFTVTFKEWWPQAEAAVGFLNAYQVSNDEIYFAASRKSWTFIENHLIDRKNGGWYQGVSRDGKKQSRTKLSFWKCPYHNGRACMELIDRLHALRSSP